MDESLKLILQVIAGLLLFWLFIEFVFKNKAKKSESTNDIKPSLAPSVKDNLLLIYILPKSNSCFESYDLIQSISAAHFEFGADNIFHYMEEAFGARSVLFSLASATSSGGFDLDKIGSLSCNGLILFMDKSTVAEPHDVLDIMLDTARQLADDLDANLYESEGVAWESFSLERYRNKITEKELVT